jgi:hypothetical protein
VKRFFGLSFCLFSNGNIGHVTVIHLRLCAVYAASSTLVRAFFARFSSFKALFSLNFNFFLFKTQVFGKLKTSLQCRRNCAPLSSERFLISSYALRATLLRGSLTKLPLRFVAPPLKN